MYDALIFNKTAALVGGNIKCMCSGSAPISEEVINFLRICFCAPIVEGYGLTESMAGSFIQTREDKSSGNCGGPFACVKFKLRDIPEMNYMTTDNPPKGEVLMTGSSIFKGYFRSPENNQKVFLDGWLCTGDVA